MGPQNNANNTPTTAVTPTITTTHVTTIPPLAITSTQVTTTTPLVVTTTPSPAVTTIRGVISVTATPAVTTTPSPAVTTIQGVTPDRRLERRIIRETNLLNWNWNDVIDVSSDDEDTMDVETLFGLGINEELGYTAPETAMVRQARRNHIAVLNRHRVYSVLHALDEMSDDDEE